MSIKTFLKILNLSFAFSFFFLFSPATSLASDLPKIQAPDIEISIPNLKNFSQVKCVEGQTCEIPWLGEYLIAVYKYGIGILGIVATVVLMFAGFNWLIAFGNSSKINQSKNMIGSSVAGLVIALTSYIILYQINPELVNVYSLKIPSIKSKEETVVTPIQSVQSLQNDQETRQLFYQNNITVNKQDCTALNQTNCTSLDNLTEQTANRLLALQNACDCRIVVTGGTEQGHSENSTHYQGKALDLRYCSGQPSCAPSDDSITLLTTIHDQVGLSFGQQMEISRPTQGVTKWYNSTDGTYRVLREQNPDGSQHFHFEVIQ